MNGEVSRYTPPSGRAWWLTFFASARAMTVCSRQKDCAKPAKRPCEAGKKTGQSRRKDRVQPAKRPCAAGKKKLKRSCKPWKSAKKAVKSSKNIVSAFSLLWYNGVCVCFGSRKRYIKTACIPRPTRGRPRAHHLSNGAKTGGQGETLSAETSQNKYFCNYFCNRDFYM